MMAQKNGFTLLEILVVMVIIGILSVIGIGSFQSSQIKARDATRKSDLVQIAKALEIYYNDKGEYPLGIGGVIIGCAAETACTWGESFEDQLGNVYMIKLPADPRSSAEYYYESDGSYFQLYARLENDRDIDLNKSGDEAQSFVGTDCGTGNCNYGVASSNSTPEEGKSLTDN